MTIRARNHTGFTLIEVLVVLAIVTLILAIALPRIGLNASPAATEAYAMRVIALLDAERFAARRRGVTLSVDLDTEHRRIRPATQSLPLTLPQNLALTTSAAPPCDPSGRHAVFYADGTACAPIIRIVSTTLVRSILINPLTGAISLAP